MNKGMNDASLRTAGQLLKNEQTDKTIELVKRSGVAKGLGSKWRKDEYRWSPGETQNRETTLYDTVMGAQCYYVYITTHQTVPHTE